MPGQRVANFKWGKWKSVSIWPESREEGRISTPRKSIYLVLTVPWAVGYRLWQVLFYLPSQQLSGSPSSKVTQHRSAWWNRYNTNNIWQDNDTLYVLGCCKALRTYLSLLPWQPQSCSDKWAWSCRGPLFLLILSFDLCFFYKGGQVVRKRGQSRLAGIANVWVTSLKRKSLCTLRKIHLINGSDADLSLGQATLCVLWVLDRKVSLQGTWRWLAPWQIPPRRAGLHPR